jgi:predicted enzyme related to lactoylglutathione lyase
MPNPVVHFEVMGKDVARLHQFYGDLFGWSIRSSADFDNYGMVEDQEGAGLSGGIGKAPQGDGHVTFYVGVDDPQAYLDKAVSLGGKVVAPLMQTGDVTFGLIADPEGHMIGVAKPGDM